MRLIVTHPSCSIKTPPCCSTSRFIVCHPGRPGPHRDHSAATPLLLPAANPLLSHRCHQGRPGPHRGRSPGAPLLLLLLLLPAADPLLPHRYQPGRPDLHRGRSPAALPLTARGPMKLHRCHQGRPGPYRGCSPAAPLLVPAADTDVAQVVPVPTVVVHRQHHCWCPPRTPMSPRPSRPLPWSFTGSAAADARRGHRCRPSRPGLSEAVRRQHCCCRQRTAVTAPTVVVHRQHRRWPAVAPPMPIRPSRPPPTLFTGSAAAAACRGPTAAPSMSRRPSRPPPTLFTGSTAATTRLPAAPPMSPMSPPTDSTADATAAAACCRPAAAPPMSPVKPPSYLCRCLMPLHARIKIYTIFRNWGEYKCYISKDRIDSSYLNRCP